MDKILKILEDHQISMSAIEECLTAISRGKADEVERIFKVLDTHQISKDAIEGCLSIFTKMKVRQMR